MLIALSHLNMPELMDLPNELLHEIANQARHCDIVNLALSSRNLLALSDDALQRHIHNRDAYFPIRFGDVQQSPYHLLHPLSVIRDIIEHAEVAYYPTKIIIGDFATLDNPSHIINTADNASNGEIDQIVASRRAEINALVDSNRYIDCRKTWASILAKEHGPATAFLLTILPDLRSIELRDLSMSGEAVLSIVRKIVNESRKEDKRSYPLGKLAVLSIEGLTHTYEQLAQLYTFIELHSLRSIYCQYVLGNVKAVREKVVPWINDPERLSNITSLDFSKCALENSDLMPLFDSIKALQTFNYEYARPERLLNVQDDPDRPQDLRAGKWEPRQIVQSLLARFSDSLVTLHMTTADTEVCHGSFNAGQIFVSDLRGFQVLKKLKADTLLFIESSLEEYIVKALNEEFETARQKKIRKGNHHFALSAKEHVELVDRHTCYAINTDDRVHRLEDLLPESLEELTLCLTLAGDSSTIDCMFEGLPGRLNKLKEMTFEGGNPLKQAKKAALARAGVQIL